MTPEKLALFVNSLNNHRHPKIPAKRRYELDNALYDLADALKAAGLDETAATISSLADDIENLDTNEILKLHIFE